MTTLGRRSSQRICLHNDVGILDEAEGSRTLGRLRDVSSTGASISSEQALAIGKPLRLAFEFSPEEPPIRLHAEVVWTGRATTPCGQVLSGLRFTDLAGPDFARLRSFIERKLWQIQSFLAAVDLFSDLSDLEKLLLASVVVDRELNAGAALEESLGEGSLVIVRSGTVHCRETLADGRVSEPCAAVAGELFGGLPIDPRGLTRCVAKAATDTAMLVVTPDGFAYLMETHADLAFKLLASWALSLRDRGYAVAPTG